MGRVMSYRILLVDDDLTTTAIAEQALAREGYRAASLGSFEEAARQVTAECPDLLIAALRLGAFNGLHLLFRCRAECPDMPFVISGDLTDLTDDIDHYGARFLAKPI